MKLLFKLGQVIATPGALKACSSERMSSCLRQHANGDWGVVDLHDKRMNNESLKTGNRLLSAYPIDPEKPCQGHGDNCLWLITEADRSATTFLLPDEY